MKSSIRSRLIKSFMLIVIITVLILEFSLINGIKTYYYKTIEDVLSNQLNASIGYLDRYLGYNSLEHIVMDDIDIFWGNTTGQIQVFNEKQELLLDSLGLDLIGETLPTDVEEAFLDKKGLLIENNPVYEEETMSISMPIKKRSQVIGVLRFTTSMEETNNIIRNLSTFLLILGLIVILISGIASYFMANSIVKPLEDVTLTAEKMADGQFDTRSHVPYDDEIGKLSDTLNYMADEIIKREEIKNEFISSISHELKTPLTSIKGWAITLQYDQDGKNEMLTEGLQIIEDESDRLSNMLEELLDFSRFVSNDITLRKTEINIEDLLVETYRQLYPRGILNDIELILKLKDVNLNYLGDRNRLKQVLINLIDNAFKFSAEGSVVIINSYKTKNNIIIEVLDQGIGISKEELPHVKEKFYKGKTSKSHSGIGLSISDEIIKLHGGRLEIDSELNVGTRVRIYLPLLEVES